MLYCLKLRALSLKLSLVRFKTQTSLSSPFGTSTSFLFWGFLFLGFLPFCCSRLPYRSITSPWSYRTVLCRFGSSLRSFHILLSHRPVYICRGSSGNPGRLINITTRNSWNVYLLGNILLLRLLDWTVYRVYSQILIRNLSVRSSYYIISFNNPRWGCLSCISVSVNLRSVNA